MKETYIHPKTKDVQVLDSSAPDFDKKRQALEAKGYEWDRGPADPNFDSYDATVSGQGGYKKRQTPLKPNVQSVPGASYQTPAQPRGQSGIGADDEFLKRFGSPEPATVPTATPTAKPIAKPTVVPTAKPIVAPTPVAPARSGAQVDPNVGLPEPSPTPPVSPYDAPAQGRYGEERPKWGQPNYKPDQSLITPDAGFKLDPALGEDGKPEALKPATESLAETVQGIDQGRPPADTFKLDKKAMQDAGVNDYTVQTQQQDSINRPASWKNGIAQHGYGANPNSDPFLDTKAMENSGINAWTVPVSSRNEFENSGALPQQDPTRVDYSANGKRTLGETDLPDFPGKLPESATDTLPKSPFEGGVDNVGDTIPSGEPEASNGFDSPVDGSGGAVRPQGSLGGMGPSELAARGAPTESATDQIPPSPFAGDSLGGMGPSELAARQATAEGGMSPAAAGGAPTAPSGMPTPTTKPSIGGNSPMEGLAPLGLGDTSGMREANERGQRAWTEYDPAMQAEANLARNTAANEGKLGVGDIEKRMGEVDEARYSRAADLAKARGVALEEYMQGLNSNERKAFISTIVDSLGKILVGGFDIMTGPKTASVSQYYKGITPFDKAGADKMEKEKLDQKVKVVTDNEEDLRAAEANWMQSKQILENLRGKVNQDVFKMAMDMMDTTKKAYQQGFDVSHITAGYLSLLKDTQQFEWAKMLAGFNARLQEEIYKGQIRSKNAEIVAKGKATEKLGQSQEQKEAKGSGVKLESNAEANARKVTEISGASTKYSGGLVYAKQNRIYNGSLALADKAWEAYKASPSDATRDAYLKAIAETEKIATQIFGSNPTTMGNTKEIDRLMTAMKEYRSIAYRDPNHPYLKYGPEEGVERASLYAQDQARDSSMGKPNAMFNPSATRDETVDTTNTVGKNASVTHTGPGLPNMGNVLPSTPSETPTETPTPSETQTETPTPSATGTPTKAPGRPPNWPPTSAPQQSLMTPTKTSTQSKPRPLTTPQTQSTPPPKKGVLDEVSGAVSSIFNDGTKPLRDDATAKEIADIEKGLAVFAAKGKAKTITPEEKAEANRLIARYKELMKAQNR